MIDTHSHIYMPDFDLEGQKPGTYAGQREAVGRALAAGVERVILPAVDRTSIEPMRALHALCPAATSLAMGLHPTEVKDDFEEHLAFITDELLRNSADYVAVGEIGIDLYWDKTFEKEQMDVFDRQLALAVQMEKPVIIHCREALPQVLEVLEGHPRAKAVFHSFGGSIADVDAIRRTGDYYFGINGIVTFKNCNVRSVLPHIGTERLLTETDSPYLAPVPHRGKRNESAYTPFVLTTMAEALAMTPDALDNVTTNNAKRLFQL